MVRIVQAGKCGAWTSTKKIIVRIPASASPPNTSATTGSRVTRSVKTGSRTRNHAPCNSTAVHSCRSALSPRMTLSLFQANALEDLFTMHGHILGRVHSDAYLVAFDTQHCDRDLATDHEGFVGTACQDQHFLSPRLEKGRD